MAFFLMFQAAVVVLLKDFLTGVPLAVILDAMLNRIFDKPESSSDVAETQPDPAGTT